MRLEMHVREKAGNTARIAGDVPRVELVMPHLVAKDRRADDYRVSGDEHSGMGEPGTRSHWVGRKHALGCAVYQCVCLRQVVGPAVRA